MKELEIEIKASCDDIDEVIGKARSLGAAPVGTVEEEDRYFNHPSRDFASTDEALRIRRIGNEARVTYKGPKISLKAKTRVEVELGIDDPERLGTILEYLGFIEVGSVRKRRTMFRTGTTEICFDRVEGLGEFVELERMGTNVAAIEAELFSLAGELGLSRFERRSYLEMILEKKGFAPQRS